MRTTRKKEIRIEADRFRGKCKVSKYGIIDLFKECERMRYKLIRYPVGDNANLGFAMKRDNDIIIFTNSSSRLAREIFTLAHEIGHAILYLNSKASFEDDEITISERDSNEFEQEANYFAACLLMPDDEVRKFLDLEVDDFKKNRLSAMDITRIMSEFNVSFETALNRLDSLGLIDIEEKIKLDNEKNKIRVGNLLKSVGGNSKLNISSNEINIPHEYIEYVIYNYNHNAIPLETLEKALACYHLSIEDVSDKIIKHEDIELDDDLDELIGGLDD